MSWTSELYNIYELNSSREFDENEPVMLPIYHSTANAQIEVTLDEQGNFKGASEVGKEDAVTIIPVTEDSGARSSGVSPMPFADKLLYIAGDYKLYTNGKRSDNTGYFKAYMEQLRLWDNSEYTNGSVRAVRAYLEKEQLIKDLIGSGVLVLNDKGKLLEKRKISGIEQEDSFVRFIVNHSDLSHENKTWLDPDMYESFIAFIQSCMGEKRLCYATGEMLYPTYKHPSKIRNSGDKAKLISSNDKNGFSYRGRFKSEEEALSVSYEFSQKIHNALKWLISKQSIRIDSLTVVVWASALQPVPEFTGSYFGDEEFEDDTAPDTMPLYAELLKKSIAGQKKDFSTDTKIMIMGLDAATTGRLSISMYAELFSSEFFENIEKWHRETAWLRFNGKQKRSYINSFSIYELIKYAYGTEQGNFIDCDKQIIRDNFLRLIPCITERRRVPRDIIESLYNKASKPLAYEKQYNHRAVLEAACAMIQKEMIDYRRGEVFMSYDPECKDRNYLYGCLLAIADKAEKDAYSSDEKDRTTNARRLWNAFSARPYQTWGILEERLNPYMDKHGAKRAYYERLIGEITSKMSIEAFSDNSKLSPLYLLGYHHYTSKLYSKTNSEEE